MFCRNDDRGHKKTRPVRGGAGKGVSGVDLELTQHNKRLDALVSRILELCETEGATVLEVRMLSRRLERIIPAVLDSQEKKTLFKRNSTEKPSPSAPK